MKNILKLSAILVVLVSNTTFAQNDTIGWGRNSNYNRIYDPKTSTEIKGEITAVDQIVPMKGMSSGIHIMAKTGSETYSVHLGPKWYLDNQSIQIKVGDKVDVKGSKVTFDGKTVIIAREIIKDGNILTLRNQNGIPVWAGRGKGRGKS